MRELQVDIRLKGDPVPWDKAEGGDLAWEHPTHKHPRGRVVRYSYLLTRYRDGYPEQRWVPYEDVELCAVEGQDV